MINFVYFLIFSASALIRHDPIVKDVFQAQPNSSPLNSTECSGAWDWTESGQGMAGLSARNPAYGLVRPMARNFSFAEMNEAEIRSIIAEFFRCFDMLQLWTNVNTRIGFLRIAAYSDYGSLFTKISIGEALCKYLCDEPCSVDEAPPCELYGAVLEPVLPSILTSTDEPSLSSFLTTTEDFLTRTSENGLKPTIMTKVTVKPWLDGTCSVGTCLSKFDQSTECGSVSHPCPVQTNSNILVSGLETKRAVECNDLLAFAVSSSEVIYGFVVDQTPNPWNEGVFWIDHRVYPTFCPYVCTETGTCVSHESDCEDCSVFPGKHRCVCVGTDDDQNCSGCDDCVHVDGSVEGSLSGDGVQVSIVIIGTHGGLETEENAAKFPTLLKNLTLFFLVTNL